MKRSLILLALMLSLMARAAAQQSSDVSVFISSGYALPSSPMTFANYWKMQYGGGAGVGYALSPSVTLLGAAEYYRFALNADGVKKSFDTRYMRDIWIFNDVSLDPSAGKSSMVTASVNLRAASSGTQRMVSPYLLAGIGVMHFTLGEIALPITSTLAVNGTQLPIVAERRITGGTETAAFAQIGLGAEFNFSDWLKPFIEARYALGMTKGVQTNYLPLTAGLRVQL